MNYYQPFNPYFGQPMQPQMQRMPQMDQQYQNYNQQIPTPQQLKDTILNQKISNIKNNPIQVTIDDLPFKDDLY